MASIWAEVAVDAVRRRHETDQRARAREAILRDHAEQRLTASAITQRNEKAEHLWQLRAEEENTVARFQDDTRSELERLTGLLRQAAAEPHRNVAAFHRALPQDPAPTVDDVAAPPRPEWSDFAPPQPGLFGRRRYDRAFAAARRDHDEALARHDHALAGGLAELTQQHERRAAEQRRIHEERWNAVADGLAIGNADAVDALVASSLRASTALHGLIENGRTTYDQMARELVLEIDLPDTAVVPAEAGWKYVVGRAAIEPVRPKAADLAATYAGFVAQLVLAVLNACFRSTSAEVVDVISVNGHVQTIDPATGRPDHPCVITVTTERATFDELDLRHERLDPRACLRHLGAEISRHPHALEPIEPIVNFELTKYRIAYGPDALAKIDHRMDLLEMNPFDFERLVHDLFTKMGYDTWRTESSRDDGIDAIATKSDPYMPVECIVQAKRYRGAVAPKEIQALMGAMAEKPTVTHGYLVTTSWLSPRSRQRAAGQRIHTIEHHQLAAMIKKYLGVDVVISNTPPAYKAGGSRPRRSKPNTDH